MKKSLIAKAPLVLVSFALCAAGSLARAQSGAAIQDAVIRIGTLIDPAAGKVSRDMVIVVEHGIIKSIAPAGAVVPAGRVIDLSREWVMPGLMDAHTHLALAEQSNDTLPLESTYLRESTAFRALRGMRNAMIVLAAGFTTIRDVGNSGDFAMQDVRRAVEKGFYFGPTVIDSGKIIGPFGGQSHDIPPEEGPLWRYDYVDADGPGQVRRAVRSNIYYGAGVIKLALDNSAYHYSVDELRAAVDEAHHAGIPVAVHVYGGEAADNAIEAGVDSIEHGFELSDAQLKKMKAKGIFLAGTDYPRAHLDVLGTAGGLLPDPAILAPKIIDRLARARRIGVRAVFSTDTVDDAKGRSRADLMLDYLSVWRAAGYGSMDTLKAMTSEPAALLRVDAVRGRVAVGQAADLIGVPVDPLADLENLRRVDFVMKDGWVVKRGERSQLLP